MDIEVQFHELKSKPPHITLNMQIGKINLRKNRKLEQNSTKPVERHDKCNSEIFGG